MAIALIAERRNCWFLSQDAQNQEESEREEGEKKREGEYGCHEAVASLVIATAPKNIILLWGGHKATAVISALLQGGHPIHAYERHYTYALGNAWAPPSLCCHQQFANMRDPI